MSNLKYSKDHEWFAIEGDFATVGITAFAAAQLGEVVYVELPSLGVNVETGEEIVVIESVKAAGAICSAISGSVVDVNTELSSSPEAVNEDPAGAGWMVKIRMSNLSEIDELMAESDYQALCDLSS